MLLVDHPDDFHRLLPGLLPRTLRSGAPGVPEGGPSGTDPFVGELLRTLDSRPAGRWWMDTALPAGIESGFWTTCCLVGRAGHSQYDALRRMIGARQELPGHVACLALSGRGFHGQQGRTWEAAPGNLHLSLGLRCDLAAPDCGLALTMLPAVAVVDALAALGVRGSGPDGPGIKWVNDILLAGRKMGGVLTSVRSQDGRILSAVMGIGLNVGAAPAVAPTPFTPATTCLNEHLPPPGASLAAVLISVLQAVAVRYRELAARGPEPLLAAYRSASLVLGREVEIHQDHPSGAAPRQGRVLAIGPDLALTLSDGPAPVTAGRLVLKPADRAHP